MSLARGRRHHSHRRTLSHNGTLRPNRRGRRGIVTTTAASGVEKPKQQAARLRIRTCTAIPSVCPPGTAPARPLRSPPSPHRRLWWVCPWWRDPSTRHANPASAARCASRRRTCRPCASTCWRARWRMRGRRYWDGRSCKKSSVGWRRQGGLLGGMLSECVFSPWEGRV